MTRKCFLLESSVHSKVLFTRKFCAQALRVGLDPVQPKPQNSAVFPHIHDARQGQKGRRANRFDYLTDGGKGQAYPQPGFTQQAGGELRADK